MAFQKHLDIMTSCAPPEHYLLSLITICDQIQTGEVAPSPLLLGIKRKIRLYIESENPFQSLLALQVLESVVKNCGDIVKIKLTTKAYCDILHELAKIMKYDDVKSKLLELIQTWTYAFGMKPQHINLKALLNTMKAEGFNFPDLQISDATLAAYNDSKWPDGDVCHRCRMQFAKMQVKKDCRACRHVFCDACSAKHTSLFHVRLATQMRICDTCYNPSNRREKESLHCFTTLFKKKPPIPIYSFAKGVALSHTTPLKPCSDQQINGTKPLSVPSKNIFILSRFGRSSDQQKGGTKPLPTKRNPALSPIIRPGTSSSHQQINVVKQAEVKKTVPQATPTNQSIQEAPILEAQPIRLTQQQKYELMLKKKEKFLQKQKELATQGNQE